MFTGAFSAGGWVCVFFLWIEKQEILKLFETLKTDDDNDDHDNGGQQQAIKNKQMCALELNVSLYDWQTNASSAFYQLILNRFVSLAPGVV